MFLNVYCFFISLRFSLLKINYFPLEVFSYTFLKNIGDIEPFIPSDKITLFYDMKNFTPFFEANSKSISIKISHVVLIPLITS